MTALNKFFGGEVEVEDAEEEERDFVRRISWSQFKTFQKCPKQWQLKYRDGYYIPSDSIHTIFGTALHEALQKYLQVLYHKSVKEAEKLDLEEILVQQMRQAYLKAKDTFLDSEWKDEGERPASYPEMKKFLMDGKKILNSFKSNRTDYFNTQKTELIGIELEVNHNIKDNIDYIGYLDVVLRDKDTGKYKIIDLKTSKSGWDKWKKKDKMRVNQLVSYKSYYSEVLDTDPKNIEVEYIILKRVLNENIPYRQSRIQSFSPPSGSITQNTVREQIDEFVSKAYNSDGSRKQRDFEATPEKFNCPFCPFSKQFNGDHPVCDHVEFDNYPEGMRGYVDDKWIGD